MRHCNLFDRTRRALRTLGLALGLTVAPLAAQSDAPPPGLTDPTIDLAELELQLTPLDKDELVKLADAWKGVLKAKASEISAQKVQQMKTEDAAAKSQIMEKITALADERTRIADRLKAVLGELTSKGGEEEANAFSNYMGAVSSPIELGNVKEPSAVLVALKNWALSSEGGIRWAKNIAAFVAILIAFKILAAIAGKIVAKALSMSRVNVSALLKDFFVTTIRKVVFFVGLIVALSMLEVNITPLLAAFGGVAFVVGFALQGTLSNFACGIMILLYRPYDIGDVVTVAGVTGKVDAMSLVSTTLKTPDNQNVVVPNGSIWGGIITNITGNDTRRVDLVFGIGYDDDIGKAQKILEELVASHELVLKDPAPVVKVNELADSSVNFVCRPWTKTSDYWAVYWDLTRAVKERFDAEGISIPFPQQDVHMHQVTTT